jgi:putative endonuclease
MSKVGIGRRAENLARDFFQKMGFIVVDRNFNCRFGEIDLIIRKHKALRFVEVKYRSRVDHGLPQEAVVKRKQQRIRASALIWLKRRHLPLDGDLHFDVLAIHRDARGKTVYDFIEDAF